MSRDGLEVRDNLVQRLIEVRWALELGRHEQAAKAAHAALAQAQELVGDLIEDRPDELGPGDLRRAEPYNP